MGTDARYVNEVRRIVLETLAGYAVDVYFFGSRAWGTEHRYSDIDVAVLKQEALRAGKWLAVSEQLGDSWVWCTQWAWWCGACAASLREKVIARGIRWNG